MSSKYQSFRIGQDDKPSHPSTNPWLKGNEGYCFQTQQDFQDALSNPLYETNAEFRAAVAVVLARSPGLSGSPQINTGGLITNRAKARADEDKRIAHEMALELFSNPKYQTSAVYRREVEDRLRASDPDALDAALGYSVVNRVGKAGRIQLGEADLNEIQTGIKKEAADKRVAEAKQAALNAYHEAMNTADHEDDDGSNEGHDAPAAAAE